MGGNRPRAGNEMTIWSWVPVFLSRSRRLVQLCDSTHPRLGVGLSNLLESVAIYQTASFGVLFGVGSAVCCRLIPN